jgi:hypothetical protein
MDPIDKRFGEGIEEQRPDLRGQSVAEILSMLTPPSIGWEEGINDPESHGSPVAASSPPIAPESSGSTNVSPIALLIADAPPMTPGSGDRPPEDLAQRSSNGPGLPEPPIKSGQRPVVARFDHLPLVLVLAAVVAAGGTLVTFPDALRKWRGEIYGLITPLFEVPSRAKIPTKVPRLVVKPQKGVVNEPLPMGVLLSDASGSEKVILAGLAIGTRLSAGTPVGLTSWEMLAREAVDALVYPPKDFVGLMVAVIDLRSPGDWLMDSQTIRFEWIRKDKERLSN